jgi:hypothetical protein
MLDNSKLPDWTTKLTGALKEEAKKTDYLAELNGLIAKYLNKLEHLKSQKELAATKNNNGKKEKSVSFLFAKFESVNLRLPLDSIGKYSSYESPQIKTGFVFFSGWTSLG